MAAGNKRIRESAVMKPKIWARIPASNDDTSSPQAIARTIFLSSIGDEEAVVSTKKFTLQSNTVALADVASAVISEAVIQASSWDSIMILGLVYGHPVYVHIYSDAHEECEPIGEYAITVTGHRRIHAPIFDAVEQAFADRQHAQIHWWYKDEGRGPSSRTIYLPPIETELRPEFYPDLNSPSGFLGDYMQSDAAVLLIAGPPGTGKTTLLRHLICDHRLIAHVVYDEELMEKDSIFQSFLFGRGDVMIIEDADTILTSREHDGNKLMARFLNVSDGLIKLPNKKVVFTTNIGDFGRVDQALVRPGRCFGVLHTRALNLKEAQTAANAADLPIPSERREYTLAELFNQGAGAVTRRVGFAS
jgi:hypothetical protein